MYLKVTSYLENPWNRLDIVIVGICYLELALKGKIRFQ